MNFDVEQVMKEMTLEEKTQMCSGRDFWKTQDMERLGIPKVMMCDGPNGLRKQEGEADHLGINKSIQTVCYPTASAMASSFDENLMQELGELLGEECQAENVGMLLGPGVNMKRSPLCGRNFEYLSEDPYQAGKMASAYIRGIQGRGVAACVKHFAANNQETRRMSGSSQVGKRALYEIYFPAFEMAVKEGKVRSVMCAYNALNGIFCSENKYLLTDVLRREWGFEGFVVTDWGASKNRAEGIKAGVDLEMPGSTMGKTESIINAVKEGTLSEEALDQAVRNVLTFVKVAVDQKKEVSGFDRTYARERSACFAAESAVLLKNDGILPINAKKKVAFIGPFAKDVRYQGAGSSHINVEKSIAAMDCAESFDITYAEGFAVRGNRQRPDLLQEAVELAKKSDIAVVFAGLSEEEETEGCDRENMSLSENQNVLIRELSKANQNLVVVLHGGSPVEIPWKNAAAAILCMYLGGDSVGMATMQLLFGEKNPSGKLAETWPVKLADNPSYLNFPGEEGVVSYQEDIFIGYRYYDKKQMPVAFPFGHGLSYTTFQYTDISSDRKVTDNHSVLTVKCKVKNTGKCIGKEVVQLYVAPGNSKVRRPVRELKGFKKVELAPGEEKEVEFILDSRSFAYYEEKINDWYVESGDYAIEIGASSRDIRLKEMIHMDSDQEIPVYFTRNSTVEHLARTAKGRQVMSRFMNTSQEAEKKDEKEDDQTDVSMGAGAKRMKEAMMREMPLAAFVTYGKMTDQQLDELIRFLNQ